MLCTNSSNGYFGCLKCQQKGEWIDFGKGGHHIFRFDPNNIDKPLRTQENYKEDLDQKQNGILGECILSDLTYFCPVISTNIDFMHSVCLGNFYFLIRKYIIYYYFNYIGLTKLLFVYWFEHSNLNAYSLKSKMDLLNEKLLSCKPPQYVQQAPRRFEDFKNWRAHEYMNFLLFFAIPVFKDIMEEIYYKHLLSLIIPIEYLLSKNIDKRKLNLVHQSLVNFVKDLEILYDQHIMTSASHELLHLVLCTETLGPLNELDCFPFEESNRKVTRFIKGQDLVGDEYFKLLNASKNLILHINNLQIEDNKCTLVKFIKTHFKIRSSNTKNKRNEICYLKLGKSINNESINLTNQMISCLNKYNINDLNNISFFERIYINNIVYSIDKDTKFCNSVISLENKLGLIFYILNYNDICYFVCKNLVYCSNCFYNNINLKSNFSTYNLSNSYFIIKQDNFQYLKKHFLFFNQNDSTYLISKLTTSHIFS
jgi:hypothetical protein